MNPSEAVPQAPKPPIPENSIAAEKAPSKETAIAAFRRGLSLYRGIADNCEARQKKGEPVDTQEKLLLTQRGEIERSILAVSAANGKTSHEIWPTYDTFTYPYKVADKDGNEREVVGGIPVDPIIMVLENQVKKFDENINSNPFLQEVPQMKTHAEKERDQTNNDIAALKAYRVPVSRFINGEFDSPGELVDGEAGIFLPRALSENKAVTQNNLSQHDTSQVQNGVISSNETADNGEQSTDTNQSIPVNPLVSEPVTPIPVAWDTQAAAPAAVLSEPVTSQTGNAPLGEVAAVSPVAQVAERSVQSGVSYVSAAVPVPEQSGIQATGNTAEYTGSGEMSQVSEPSPIMPQSALMGSDMAALGTPSWTANGGSASAQVFGGVDGSVTGNQAAGNPSEINIANPQPTITETISAEPSMGMTPASEPAPQIAQSPAPVVATTSSGSSLFR